MKIEIGDEEFTKEPNIMEELAYRDTWGKGTDSFISMIYERLSLMRDLLADDGSIYVHCDYRVAGYIRFVLDELFGRELFLNKIIWGFSQGAKSRRMFGRKHNTIFWYSKQKDKQIFNVDAVKVEMKSGKESFGGRLETDEDGRKYRLVYGTKNSQGETKYYKYYLDEGKIPEDYWTDINSLQSGVSERIDYPTQKPEALIERIIKASSNKGDIVADFFVGSGTTLAVSEKLNRKWIGADLGKFAIHTTRKRLIGVQRELKNTGKNYRAFEILNLGKYERQHYIGVNPNLRDEEKQKQIAKKEKDFINLILHAYQSQAVENFKTFHGKKNNRLVAIGPINLPVTRLFVEEIILECREKHITKVDILAFEFEMGLFPNIQEEAKSKGIDLALKYIPREVFDKRAVEKNQVVFNDVSYIEVKPHYKGNSVAIELTDFSVFYNQDTIKNAEESLKDGSNKIIIDTGKIIKVSKDKLGIVSKEVLTKNWTDWVDYWAVDFDFESKKELIRVEIQKDIKQDGTLKLEDYDKEYEEVWTGDYVFENEWQSFRTKKNRTVDLKSIYKECTTGRRKVAVKVVDIFGNDTMKIIDVDMRGT